MANILEAYEYYLLATFLLGLFQVRNYMAAFQFVLRFPGKYPKIYKILRANLNVILTWPLVVVGGCTLGLWAFHMLLRRVLLPQADVAFADLAARPGWLALAAFFFAFVLVVDVWAIVRVARFRAPRLQALYTVTEAGLSTKGLGGPLRMIVGWRIRRRMLNRLPVLMRWTYRRAGEVAARLALGSVLWIGWATRLQ